MTITVANTANTNTWGYLRDRLNDLATAMSTKTVTVNSNSTTGNAVVNGVFVATTLVANTALRGGNETTSAVLTITTNVAVTGTRLYVGANVVANQTHFSVGNTTVNSTLSSTTLTIQQSGNLSINSSSLAIDGVSILPQFVNTNISGNTAAIVDSFPMDTFQGAEYTFSIKNNAANGYQVSKLLVLSNDGTAPQVTDYGMLFSNNQLVVFSANANSTHVRLVSTTQLADASSNVQIKGFRMSLVI